MAILAFFAAVAVLVFGWSDDREEELSAGDIARIERARMTLRQTA